MRNQLHVDPKLYMKQATTEELFQQFVIPTVGASSPSNMAHWARYGEAQLQCNTDDQHRPSGEWATVE
jgi:uncharacterized protein YllA (UPF0747 family)